MGNTNQTHSQLVLGKAPEPRLRVVPSLMKESTAKTVTVPKNSLMSRGPSVLA